MGRGELGLLAHGPMNLEDDVESMLSDQLNVSNDSVFKLKGVSAAIGGLASLSVTAGPQQIGL